MVRAGKPQSCCEACPGLGSDLSCPGPTTPTTLPQGVSSIQDLLRTPSCMEGSSSLPWGAIGLRQIGFRSSALNQPKDPRTMGVSELQLWQVGVLTIVSIVNPGNNPYSNPYSNPCARACVRPSARSRRPLASLLLLCVFFSHLHCSWLHPPPLCVPFPDDAAGARSSVAVSIPICSFS